ncbi:MAG: hypothetical protein IPN47_00495 [Gemmatimonadetes bacterium]|jgi:hypothetical protein|nr:hypothetical protein [Gemmatimonadota bacterium]
MRPHSRRIALSAIALATTACSSSIDSTPIPSALEFPSLSRLLMDSGDNPTAPSGTTITASYNWSPKATYGSHKDFWVNSVSGGAGGPYFYEWHVEYCDRFDVCGNSYQTKSGRDSTTFAIDMPSYVAYARAKVLINEDHAPNYPSYQSGAMFVKGPDWPSYGGTAGFSVCGVLGTMRMEETTYRDTTKFPGPNNGTDSAKYAPGHHHFYSRDWCSGKKSYSDSMWHLPNFDDY